MRRRLTDTVIALFASWGYLLPLLAVLGIGGQLPLALAVSAGFVLLMEAASLRRWSAWTLAGLLTAGATLWVSLLGGTEVLMEIGSALLLRAEGFRTAVPFVARESALLLALLCALLGFALSRERAGIVPALMGLILVLLILWLSGMEAALPDTAPGVAAVLLLIIRERGERGQIPRRAWPVVLALTALTFLISPLGTLPTTPIKENADALRQRIMDLFFFTQPRNVFSLAEEGYYPQGSGQMGGPASPTEHPVMTVQTPRVTYLRGSVRNSYTGRVWRDTTGGRRYLWVSPRWRSLREALFDASLPGEALSRNTLLNPETVSVEMNAGNVSSLFVPQRVRELRVGGDLVPYFNNASEVFVTRDQEAGDSYRVTAPLAVGGDVGLETILTSCAANADMPDADFLALYTALPAHLQEQVYALARQVTEGQSSDYGKALALRDWLRASCAYTLDAPWQPEDADFVTYFLLTTRQGYCVHFASAMTVLCRMVGLPARYVEGYLAQPVDGTAYVTGLDAHAWTEVYFPGYGWLTFDATPPENSTESEESSPTEADEASPDTAEDSDSQPTPPGETETPAETPPPEGGESEPTPTPVPTSSPEPSESPDPDASDEGEGPGDPPSQSEESSTPQQTPVWLWLLLALLLILALMILRIRMNSPARLAAKTEDESTRWLIWFSALAEALAALRLGRLPSETPAVWLTRVDAVHPFDAALAPVSDCASALLYGHLEASADDCATAEHAYQTVWHSLGKAGQFRLLLRRLGRRKSAFTL